jgi:hypothetical protein
MELALQPPEGLEVPGYPAVASTHIRGMARLEPFSKPPRTGQCMHVYLEENRKVISLIAIVSLVLEGGALVESGAFPSHGCVICITPVCD